MNAELEFDMELSFTALEIVNIARLSTP